MKPVPALILPAVLFAATAASGQEGPRSGPATKPPAATPEWTDHNEHDPGAAAPAHTAPSQTKVLTAPAAVKRRPPCERGAATAARSTDGGAGRITFGDGRHGRRPQAANEDCVDANLDSAGAAKRKDGDPDRPLTGGRVSNPDDKK